MIAEIFIACLVAVATGIFTWLFFIDMRDKLLEYKQSYTEDASARFSELFVFFDVSKYLYYYLVISCIIPALIFLVTRYLPLAIGFFIIILCLPRVVLRVMIKRRIKQFEKQLPDAILLLAGSLRAGASLSIALDSLIKESEPPLSQEFSLFVRERKLGVDMDTAIANMEKRLPLEDLFMCFSAIQISREVGGNLAEALESLSETLRRKLIMEGKINSLTAQGKLQGIVMSSLPLFLMAALMKLEPQAMGMMFHSKIGWMVLAIIAVMQLLGFFAIRKITEIDV